jgi:hypothetical protein
MSKKQHSPRKEPNPTPGQKVKSTGEEISFFLKNEKYLLMGSIVLALFLFIQLFDIRVSETGDDASYIQMAYNLVHEGKLPSFQGPMYPFVLSVIIAVFGLKIAWMKILSLIFMVSSIYFMYRAFRNVIPNGILWGALFLFSVNGYIGFYASSTYSEPLYIFLQSVFLFYFIKIYEPSLTNQWKDIKHSIILAFMVLVLMLTRNIAAAAPFAVVIFLLLQKRWIESVKFTSLLALFYFTYTFIRNQIFGMDQNQLASQGSGIFLKNPYKPGLGKEDFLGFVQRFIDNTYLYLSKHFLKQLGFLPEDSKLFFPLFAFIIVAIGLFGLYWAIRQKKSAMLIVILYSLAMISATFLALQKLWDQDRMILIYFPLLIIIIWWVFIELSVIKKSLSFIAPVAYGLLVVVFLFSIQKTLIRIQKNHDVFYASMKGDMMVDLTPDVKNYLLISKYAAENVSKDSVIACRKPSIAFIHSGRSYHGIYTIPYVDESKVFINNKIYTIIDLNEWFKKANRDFTNQFVPYLKSVFQGISVDDKNPKYDPNTRYLIFEFSAGDTMATALLKPGFNVIKDQNDFFNSFKERYHAFPNELKQYLLDNKVAYVMSANLRLNPKKKTPNTINTLERFLTFVEIKYPGCLSLVHEVGSDEKAALYKLDLHKYNY